MQNEAYLCWPATYIWYVNMQGNFFDMGLIYVGIQNDYVRCNLLISICGYINKMNMST